nr:MAG TPA: hypothetical protein [Caudoviricetes sp.]DAO27996.1 MAG TPA: hypothetical protein [Caudoviricetes sp.]DAZ67623.1 MAG TPA: hypothetical protein [Caudoviricetes sp.]
MRLPGRRPFSYLELFTSDSSYDNRRPSTAH